MLRPFNFINVLVICLTVYAPLYFVVLDSYYSILEFSKDHDCSHATALPNWKRTALSPTFSWQFSEFLEHLFSEHPCFYKQWWWLGVCWSAFYKPFCYKIINWYILNVVQVSYTEACMWQKFDAKINITTIF